MLKKVLIFIGLKVVEIAGLIIGIIVTTLLGYGLEALNLYPECMGTPALHFVVGLGCITAVALSIMTVQTLLGPWIKWNWNKAKTLSDRRK